jgi:hypothetical protein
MRGDVPSCRLLRRPGRSHAETPGLTPFPLARPQQIVFLIRHHMRGAGAADSSARPEATRSGAGAAAASMAACMEPGDECMDTASAPDSSASGGDSSGGSCGACCGGGWRAGGGAAGGDEDCCWDEWCGVAPGDAATWNMVKAYLLQVRGPLPG